MVSSRQRAVSIGSTFAPLQQQHALEEDLPSWLGKLLLAWNLMKSAVVTLNYDTLVEHGFVKIATMTKEGRPSHRSLYVIPLPDIRSRAATLYSPVLTDTFRLFKLHGSIGWAYSGSTSYFGETIYDIGLNYGWAAAAAERVDDFKNAAPDKVPLIAPPTSSKSSFFANELMRSQWQLARVALAPARKLYCLGYSLPMTDQAMRYFIRSSGTQELEIVPVNNDSNVYANYEEAFPLQRVETKFIGTDGPIPRFIEGWLAESGIASQVEELWARRSESTEPA